MMPGTERPPREKESPTHQPPAASTGRREAGSAKTAGSRFQHGATGSGIIDCGTLRGEHDHRDRVAGVHDVPESGNNTVSERERMVVVRSPDGCAVSTGPWASCPRPRIRKPGPGSGGLKTVPLEVKGSASMCA